tara:strand:+ start:30 stop:188 length:159 start_codon:yes stop_codon:yes gene_type:complete
VRNIGGALMSVQLLIDDCEIKLKHHAKEFLRLFEFLQTLREEKRKEDDVEQI